MFGIENFINRWRMWRYGGITGLNYFEKQTKMTTGVAGSWLLGYLLLFMFAPDPYLELSIGVFCILWVVAVAGLVMYAKYDATNYRVFAQSVWHFPDGGKRKYDLMIDPDTGFSKEHDFKDGSQGWRLNFIERLQYWDKRSDFPFIFSYALFRLRKSPDESFQYLSIGEIFNKGFAIKTPSEHISVYVYKWVQDKDGMYVPVCAINDCSLAYSEALKKKKIEKDGFSDVQAIELTYRHERRRRLLLEKHSRTLEDALDVKQRDRRKMGKLVDDECDTRRTLYKSIMDMGVPLVQRIKENWLKIVALVFVVLFILWLIGWI